MVDRAQVEDLLQVDHPHDGRQGPVVVFPLLIWAALRFGPRGASLSLLVVSGLTVLNTARNTGPFVRESITDSVLAALPEPPVLPA